MQSKFGMPVFLLVLGTGSILAQPSVCVTSATPPIVRAEGLTERIGDILVACTGTPGNTLNANFTIGLNATVTNRISSGTTLTGIIFTIDSGAGPQPVLTQPFLAEPNAITYDGVAFTFSPQGAVNFRIAGIRVNASQIPAGSDILASISVNNAGLGFTPAQVVTGTPERGLYASYGSSEVSTPYGSPLPDTLTFSGLIAEGTARANTRVTEGFGDAFQPLSGWANLNADTGERILIRYSGFPDGASLYIPDVVAGSDAVQPTSGGWFGLPVSGGVYAPSASGSLLLARVPGANSSGAGGSPVYVPGAIGSGSVSFNSVSAVPVMNGSGYAVYEVVDANPSAIESAQYPTFFGLAANENTEPTTTSEEVFFAASSNVGVATTSDPIPRFLPLTALPDCGIAGGCDATPPKLSSDTTSLQFTEQAGGGYQVANVAITNSGGGAMQWTATVSYGSGASGWLSITPSKGINSGTLQTVALPHTLAPGTYTATLTVNAGLIAGVIQIPATLVVTAPPAPTISSVLNAASLLAEPVVPGSISTVMGTLFGGSNVSATFNNLPATILFSNDTQINLVVPAGLTGQTSAQLVVTVDGNVSSPTTVTVAPFEPGIFAGGIVNQDGTVNSSTNGAAPGSIIALWATGLSGTGTITGNIGGENIATPYYAGPAPGLAGVQQVNLIVPTDLAPMTTQVYVCGIASGAAQVCSVPVPLTVK
jgi:uncharacterized protein (TIGR03437 family)